MQEENNLRETLQDKITDILSNFKENTSLDFLQRVKALLENKTINFKNQNIYNLFNENNDYIMNNKEKKLLKTLQIFNENEEKKLTNSKFDDLIQEISFNDKNENSFFNVQNQVTDIKKVKK